MTNHNISNLGQFIKLKYNIFIDEAIDSGDIRNIRTVDGGTQLFIINKRHVYLSELTPTTVLPLAKTTAIKDEFEMYWDGAPVLANNYGMAILSNVSSDGEISA